MSKAPNTPKPRRKAAVEKPETERKQGGMLGDDLLDYEMESEKQAEMDTVTDTAIYDELQSTPDPLVLGGVNLEPLDMANFQILTRAKSMFFTPGVFDGLTEEEQDLKGVEEVVKALYLLNADTPRIERARAAKDPDLLEERCLEFSATLPLMKIGDIIRILGQWATSQKSNMVQPAESGSTEPETVGN